MDQPLGYAVGNALEVKEAIDTVNGCGPKDFVELCMTLGSLMLIAGGVAQDEESAQKLLKKAVDDGSALKKLAEFVKAQGGDERAVYDTSLLPKAQHVIPVCSDEEGYIYHIECDEVGICSLILGGGRETKESNIDLSVGIVLSKKTGDYVKKGDVLAYIHANDLKKADTAAARLLKAYEFSKTQPERLPLIRGILK
jgi:pyrimidine-nucleoside phosphorylase